MDETPAPPPYRPLLSDQASEDAFRSIVEEEDDGGALDSERRWLFREYKRLLTREASLLSASAPASSHGLKRTGSGRARRHI